MQVRGLVFSLPVALFLRFLLLSGVDEKEGFDCWLKDEDRAETEAGEVEGSSGGTDMVKRICHVPDVEEKRRKEKRKKAACYYLG